MGDLIPVSDMQVRQWAINTTKPAHLLCDARSTPPRVAAVCICEGKVFYSDMQPSEATLAQFKVRGDNQIASLELLAIAFGQTCYAVDVVQPCLLFFRGRFI